MGDGTKKTGGDGQAFAGNVKFVGCSHGHPQSMTTGGLDQSSTGKVQISSFSKEIAINTIKTNTEKLGISCVDIEIENIYRFLTSGEMKMARRMYSNKQGESVIPYDQVKIYQNNFLGSDVAVTPAGDINWPESQFVVDFSRTSLLNQNIFIHEIAHVWQFYMQQSPAIKSTLAQGHAILTTGNRNNAYRYELDGRLLGAYNVEQQAEIIADYYCLRYMGPSHTFSKFAAAFVQKNNLVSVYKDRLLPENKAKRTYENALFLYKDCLQYFLYDPTSHRSLYTQRGLINVNVSDL